jgi:hypothetical protein
MLLLKVKKIRFFNICKIRGRIQNPHVDRHCLDANPDPDLNQHQNKNSDSNTERQIKIRIRIRSGIKTMAINNSEKLNKMVGTRNRVRESDPDNSVGEPDPECFWASRIRIR